MWLKSRRAELAVSGEVLSVGIQCLSPWFAVDLVLNVEPQEAEVMIEIVSGWPHWDWETTNFDAFGILGGGIWFEGGKCSQGYDEPVEIVQKAGFEEVQLKIVYSQTDDLMVEDLMAVKSLCFVWQPGLDLESWVLGKLV